MNKKSGKWIMLTLLFMSYFSVNYAQFLFVSFTDGFMKDFNVLPVEVSALTFSYTIVAGIVGAIGGMLADRFGSCKTMMMLGIVSTIGAFARLFVTNFYLFFFCSLFVGALFGGSLSINGKLIRAWFEPGENGLAFSILSTGSALSVVVAMFSYPIFSGYKQACLVSGIIIAVVSISWIIIGKDAPVGSIPVKTGNVFKNIPKIVKLPMFWVNTIAALSFSSMINIMATKLPGVLNLQFGIEKGTASNINAVYSIFLIVAGFVIPIVQKKIGTFKTIMVVLEILGLVGLELMIFLPLIATVVVLCLTGFAISVLSGFFSTILANLKGINEEFLGTAMGIQVLARFVIGVFVIVPYVATPIIEMNYNMFYVCSGTFLIIQLICTFIMPEIGKKKR